MVHLQLLDLLDGLQILPLKNALVWTAWVMWLTGLPTSLHFFQSALDLFDVLVECLLVQVGYRRSDTLSHTLCHTLSHTFLLKELSKLSAGRCLIASVLIDAQLPESVFCTLESLTQVAAANNLLLLDVLAVRLSCFRLVAMHPCRYSSRLLLKRNDEGKPIFE